MGYTQKLGLLAQSVFQDSSLNVGIGGSPSGSYKFEVTGTSKFSSRINLNASSGFAELYLKGASSTTGMYLFDNGTESGLWKVDSGYMAFATTNTERIRITSTGNVGIGTSSPSSIFEVAQTNGIITQRGNTGYSVFRSYGGDGTNSDVVEFQIRNRVDGSNMVSIGNFTSHDLTFRTANTERMRITSDGKLKLNSTSAGGTNLEMYLIENDGLYINSNEGATARAIYFQTGGTQRMLITSSGNVSVNSGSSVSPELAVRGTTGSNSVGGSARLGIYDDATSGSRGWLLQIDGSSQLRTFYYNGSAWSTNGYQTTGGTWTNSDERRKENISLLGYGLNEVLQLIPKQFNYKVDELKKPYMGFVAQDVLPIIPEAVQSYLEGEKEDEKEFYAMNYDNLVPVLVKAIQEQNQLISELSAKVSALENKS
jgi:hypothetical protein